MRQIEWVRAANGLILPLPGPASTLAYLAYSKLHAIIRYWTLGQALG
jgi:hypothetical protein